MVAAPLTFNQLAFVLELVPERELEVALRVRTAVSGGVDDARAACRSQRAARELADESIGVVQIDVVEEVDRFDAEF